MLIRQSIVLPKADMQYLVVTVRYQADTGRQYYLSYNTLSTETDASNVLIVKLSRPKLKILFARSFDKASALPSPC